MTSAKLQQAEQRQSQAERVRTLVANLRALLEGRTNRAEVLTWLGELSPPGGERRGPFPSQPALSVYHSILALNERWGGDALVREVELRAYLRWLVEGECFVADDDAVIVLARDIDDFADQCGTEAVRWWHQGLGWWTSLQFCSPVSGRPFVGHADLKQPTGVGLAAQRGVDRNDAIVDLFEALAIDDQDVSFIHPQVDLARLPTWVLWRQDDNGNRFEMARLRSYAKACAQQQLFTDRGHKQIYWVDSA